MQNTRGTVTIVAWSELIGINTFLFQAWGSVLTLKVPVDPPSM